jgi:Lon protease-like protein
MREGKAESLLRFLRGGADRRHLRLPLFPLKAVLFPGGLLPLRIFEQRYIEMAKSCLRDGQPFGVCLILRGDEVAKTGSRPAPAPEFASIGTLATIGTWDMPQLGILHVTTEGGARFEVRSHAVQPDGLVVAEATPIAPEPPVPLDERNRPLADLLDVLVNRIGPQHFGPARAFDDASWVGYRLAEILPLPLSIKQNMLEINDADIRLATLRRYLEQQGLL